MIHIITRGLILCLFFLSQMSLAGIQPGSTRIIYPAEKREVTLQIMNNAATPRLIQTWIDRGEQNSQPQTATSPFFVTPPISRLDPDRGQTLRIAYIGGDAPTDRESVFWLNILELQPKSKAQMEEKNNVVQFSIRTRIKVFYRPQGLPGRPEEAIDQVSWRIEHEGKDTLLECENASAFNVSFHDIRLGKNPLPNKDPIHGMCPAKGKAKFKTQDLIAAINQPITVVTINDYGGFEEHEINRKLSGR